jgi:GNAT superfamily N-acetyltransferase
VAGGHRGYICGPSDVGVTGAELDRLIARQRDYFAARSEAVGWPVHAHDQPTDLTARLRRGFARLLGGSTLPQWRGRGIYRALVAVRAQRGAARGVKYLQVEASETVPHSAPSAPARRSRCASGP